MSENTSQSDVEKKTPKPRNPKAEPSAINAKARAEKRPVRKFKSKHRGTRKTETDLPDVSMVSRFASIVCPYCGEIIKDITGAIASKESGAPAHFECVLNFLEEHEPHAQNETIIYIGRGNFAVVIFENPNTPKKFKIVRMIEWEDKNSIPEWRTSILDYYDLSKPVIENIDS